MCRVSEIMGFKCKFQKWAGNFFKINGTCTYVKGDCNSGGGACVGRQGDFVDFPAMPALKRCHLGVMRWQPCAVAVAPFIFSRFKAHFRLFRAAKLGKEVGRRKRWAQRKEKREILGKNGELWHYLVFKVDRYVSKIIRSIVCENYTFFTVRFDCFRP